VATVVLALVLPLPVVMLPLLGVAAKACIALLFFLYGARLAPQAVWQGLLHWRLQVLVLLATFGLFPALGLASRVLVPALLSPHLYVGILFLCLLPSTVQSSIAFTSLAGGNVAAAVSATSASSVIGIVATPVLADLLIGAGGDVSLSSLEGVLLQLQLPFLAGQAVRPWIAPLIERKRRLVSLVDRVAVLLIVYMAVSAAAGRGVWQVLRPLDLFGVVLTTAMILALALGFLVLICRRIGLPRPDEIAVVFCGGNKGLVTGVSMLSALLPADVAGMAVLPLIVFHQIQLIASATVAARYARASERQG
jgi:solute carrier family 10 (sodium/bile acid cotransporter), member 7